MVTMNASPVRPARPAEVPALQRLTKEVVAELKLPSQLAYWGGPELALEAGHDVDVVPGSEEPLGFVQCRSLSEDSVNINLLVVSSQARGQHLGEQLLLSALQKFADRGYKKAVVQVEVGNDKARALYDKYGFSPTQILRGYYKQVGGVQVDGREMELRLDSPTTSSFLQQRHQELLDLPSFPSAHYAP